MAAHLHQGVRACSVALCGASSLFVVLTLSPAVDAQHSTDFEAPIYTGSAAGDDLNGQDGYYNPIPASSVSCDVYTYAGNALGLPANPDGDDQFVAGTGPAGSIFARSQKDVPYGGGTERWRVSFDVAVTFTGLLPTADNVGSFSTQPFATAPPFTNATFIALARWTDPATAATWNADYVYFDALNMQLTAVVPDPGFQGLAIGHWYRWTTRFDLDTNAIEHLSIRDLTTGATVTHKPLGWYLAGGAAGGLPAPTGFRMFAGTTSVAGNTMAFDNIVVSCLWDLDGDGAIGITDLLRLLSAWGPNPGDDADFDNDGSVAITDLIELLGHWGFCP